MVCQRRVKPLDQRLNLTVADLEDVEIHLVVLIAGEGQAPILRHRHHDIARVSDDLVRCAKRDLLRIHGAKYMGQHLFKKPMLTLIDA